MGNSESRDRKMAASLRVLLRTFLLSHIIGIAVDRNFLFRKQPILGIEELNVAAPVSLEKIEKEFYNKIPDGYEVEVLAWRPLGNQGGLMIEGLEAEFDEVEKINEGSEIENTEVEKEKATPSKKKNKAKKVKGKKIKGKKGKKGKKK